MSFHATLVVMAAGMGSRFGGLKQAEPVGKNGEAIVDYSVYDAVAAGFDKVVFVIKHSIEKDFKELVGNRIEKKVETHYAFQEMNDLPEGFVCPETREKPWGTGQAILACKELVKEHFAVMAEECGLNPKMVVAEIDSMAKKLPKLAEQLDQELNAIHPSTVYGSIAWQVKHLCLQVAE